MRTERGAAMKRKGLLIPLVLLLAVVIGFLVYASVYYRAGGAALEALRPDGVRVEETGYGWLFDGPGEVFWFSFAIGTIAGLLFSVLALLLVAFAFHKSVFQEISVDFPDYGLFLLVCYA